MRKDFLGIVVIPTMISLLIISIIYITDISNKALNQSINLMIEDSVAIDSIINLGRNEDNHNYYQLEDTMYEIYPDGTVTKYY